jgi:hypothetical protein
MRNRDARLDLFNQFNSFYEFVRRTVGLQSLLQKFGFEIGEDRVEFRRRFHFAKGGAGAENGRHLFEIISVVGAQVNGAAGCEHALSDFSEPLVDETILEVLPLRPRIGKINVQGGRGVSR